MAANGETKLMLAGAVAHMQIDDLVKLLEQLERSVRERGLVGGDVGDGA